MRKAIAIFCVLVSASALGQAKKLRELRNELAHAKVDTSVLKLYLELGERYVPIDLHSALYYNALGQSLIEKILYRTA